VRSPGERLVITEALDRDLVQVAADFLFAIQMRRPRTLRPVVRAYRPRMFHRVFTNALFTHGDGCAMVSASMRQHAEIVIPAAHLSDSIFQDRVAA
jgi:hypothetical protein